MDCDKDCFNCKFPDCVASQRHICRANTKPKAKKQKCDRDCFNCKFEDCILTETEAATMEIQEPTYEDIPKKKQTSR